MFVSIKYFRNKFYHFLKIVSIILLLHLLPACDLSDSENYNRVVIDSASIYSVNIVNDSITRIIDGENPLFIPNTSKILFRDGDKIYTMDLNSFDKKFISDLPGALAYVYTEMYLSKNGHYIAFFGKGNTISYDLFLASLITGGSINITNSKRHPYEKAIFFNNDNNILFRESFYSPNGSSDSDGVSFTDLFGNNFTYLTSYKSPLGFSQSERYLILMNVHYTLTSNRTNIYVYDMISKSITDSILLDSEAVLYGPSVSGDMKLYYSSNKSNFYKLDLVTKNKELLWSGETSANYKFSPDFKKVLVNHLSFVELINLETSQAKIYFSGEGTKVVFGEPCFSEDSKYFLITRHYHDDYFN